MSAKAGTSMSDNKYRVPQKQWRKWNANARVAFNDIYSRMAKAPSLFTHPKALKPKSVHWKVTAWNAAWLAADAVRDFGARRWDITGERNWRAKLTARQVHQIRKRYKTNTSPSKLAHQYDIDRVTVHRIVANKLWTHV